MEDDILSAIASAIFLKVQYLKGTLSVYGCNDFKQRTYEHHDVNDYTMIRDNTRQCDLRVTETGAKILDYGTCSFITLEIKSERNNNGDRCYNFTGYITYFNSIYFGTIHKNRVIIYSTHSSKWYDFDLQKNKT